MKKYYECYSPNLAKFLEDHGQVVVKEFVHNRTQVPCKEFLITPELSALLQEWSRTKPVKKGV